jgi:hypothetical protein
LTATPIYDNPNEIFELANILNANNTNLQLPIRKDLLKNNYVQKEESKYINTGALKGGIIKITDLGMEKLSDALYGKVSFIKANTQTSPKVIVNGMPLIESREGTTNVIYCDMSEYQYKIYLKALYKDIGTTGTTGDTVGDTISDIEGEEKMQTENVVSKTTSLYKKSNEASTMVYPNGLYGEEGAWRIRICYRRSRSYAHDGRQSYFE